jgi:hypothetical protein
MAAARILYPQFRDEQQDSRYPFADNATLLSTESRLDIGRDTFYDATLYVINGARGAYISAVVVAPNAITIRVGDSGNKQRATAVYNPLSPPADGVLELLDAYGRPAGKLLSSPLALARFSGWPVATHSFSAAATEFVASVVIPANEPGVRGLRAATGSPLTQDVWLIGGRGITLRAEDEHTIRIDINGEPLFRRILCEDTGRFQSKNFLKTLTVNNTPIGPDEYGNFTITAGAHGAPDTVLRVYAADGNIRISTVGRKVV